MEKLNDIVEFLDRHLAIDTFTDASQNGLQVDGLPHVRRIVGLVDASQEGFCAAAETDADMILVHHGLFWQDPVRLTDILYARVRVLMVDGISLYAAHLPLDAHPTHGNNAGIAALIDAPITTWYAEYGGKPIACLCTYPTPRPLREVIALLDEGLETRSTVYDFGPEMVQQVGIVSGAGCAALAETCSLGADLFITGEPRLNAYHEAREKEINIAFAGHYMTERVGVRLMLEHLSSLYDVETEFIDIPCEI